MSISPVNRESTGSPTWDKPSTTAVDCEKEGHCWHPGTAVGTLYCCKCGKYWTNLPLSKQFPQLYYPLI